MKEQMRFTIGVYHVWSRHKYILIISHRRARPSYQPSVLSYIRQSISKEGSSPLNIVEIGSGTGIFTRALLAHPDWSSSVAEIRAVEPSAGMRAQFAKTVTAPGESFQYLQLDLCSSYLRSSPDLGSGGKLCLDQYRERLGRPCYLGPGVSLGTS